MKFAPLFLAAALTWSTAAVADEKEPINLGEDKFKLSAGGFFTDFSSSLRIDATEGDQSADIDVEEDLGLNSTTETFRLEGYWRVGPRHRINAAWYKLNRNGVTEISTDIEWGDLTFPVGVTIDTGVDLSIIPISYSYSFFKRENWELAASIGFHWIDIETFIQGEAFVDGQPVLSAQSRSSDVKGPFPLVGLVFDFQPAPKWQIGTSIQYLDISISKYNGRLLDAKFYVEYYIWRNVGVGLAYNYFDLNAGVTEDNFIGNVGSEYNGFMGYITSKF